MEHKTIHTRVDFCPVCKSWTPHYVQHERDNNFDGAKTVTYKTSCIVHEKHVLKETKTVHEGIYYLLIADKLKPCNRQTL